MLRETKGARWALLALAGLALGAAACSTAAPSVTSPTALAPVDMATAGDAMPTGGLISSGAVTRQPDMATPPERPTAVSGRARGVHISEALKLTTYKVLEPKALNKDFNLDATRIFEPIEGHPDPSLPKVWIVYQHDPSGSIIITQGPATGETAPGEPTDVGSHKGWYSEQPLPMLTWEQDGLRIEMRAKEESKDKLMEAALSMAPFAGQEGKK